MTTWYSTNCITWQPLPLSEMPDDCVVEITVSSPYTVVALKKAGDELFWRSMSGATVVAKVTDLRCCGECGKRAVAMREFPFWGVFR